MSTLKRLGHAFTGSWLNVLLNIGPFVGQPMSLVFNPFLYVILAAAFYVIPG